MRRKIGSTKELVDTIRAALDCQAHFHKPTIIENDKDFRLGDKATVICSSCVERMRKVIGIKDNETNLTDFAYYNYKQVKTRK